jgi:formiminotetrahydrofolate cyclodeaminase
MRLLELAGEDAQAYADSLKARKESPDAYAQAFKKAGEVPQEIIKVCQKVHGAIPFLLKEGNKNLLSDVHAAEALLKAAMAGAQIMIEANS